MFSEYNQLLLIVFLCGIVTGMYTFLCMKEECPQNSLGWCAMSYAYHQKKVEMNWKCEMDAKIMMILPDLLIICKLTW